MQIIILHYFVLLIITYIVIFHKQFFCFFQNISKCLQRLTDVASIFSKTCSIFNSFDNKETNLFLFLAKNINAGY